MGVSELETRSGSRPGPRLALGQWLDRIPGFWGQQANRVADLCGVALIFGICAVTALIGAAHTRIYGHDIVYLLDSGWRALNGQRPYADYTPFVGPVVSLFMGAGLWLAHNSVRGVGYASALMGAMVGLWAYLLSRFRMAWLPAVLASAVLALIAVAPFPLGYTPNTLSHAMAYNRWGYALLGLAVIECFPCTARNGRQAVFGGSVSSGAVSVLLLFIKPSYALVALAYIGWSLLVRPDRRRFLGITLGLAATGLGMMAYLRFDVSAIWRDFATLAAARSGEFGTWVIRWSLVKAFPEFLWLLLLGLFVSVLRSYRQTILPLLEPLAMCALLLIGGALLLGTNAQPYGYPLNAILALLLAEQGRLAAEESGLGVSSFLKADTIVVLMGLLGFAPIFIANASGLGYALIESRKNPPESEVARIAAPPMTGLLLYDMPEGTDSDHRSNGRVYVTYLNSGLDLLRRVSNPDESIYTLDILNPFPYALLRRPAYGGATGMCFNYQFNDKHKPAAEWLFGSANIIMVPKHPAASESQAQALFRNYLADVQAGYRLCAESDWWKLYKRPNRLQGCPVPATASR